MFDTPMNWFIALPVAAGAWFDALPTLPTGVRRFSPGDLHLTVAFLGGVRGESAHAAFDAVRFELAPRDVTLGAVVPMGPPARYSALSALLAAGREEVEAELGRAGPAAYEAAGATPDKRTPKAHITLARPKRNATSEERREALAWANAIDLGGASVRLEEIALYTWSEDRSSTLFRIVSRSPLPKR